MDVTGQCNTNEDVYSPMKAAQQEHKHTDRNTTVKDRQRTELSAQLIFEVQLQSTHYVIRKLHCAPQKNRLGYS